LTIDLAFYHLTDASNTVVSTHLGLKEASWSQSVPQSELASSKRRSMECRQLRSTTPPVRWAPDGPGWTIAEWVVNFLLFYGAAA
jgi:hypothetical protein